MTSQTETMSAEEAADYLKASVRTVQELAMGGALKGAKVGKGWVFFRRDVVAYLERKIYGESRVDAIVRTEIAARLACNYSTLALDAMEPPRGIPGCAGEDI